MISTSILDATVVHPTALGASTLLLRYSKKTQTFITYLCYQLDCKNEKRKKAFTYKILEY